MARFPSRDYLDFIASRYPGMNIDAIETFLEMVSVNRAMDCGMDNYFQRLGISQARFKVMVNLFYSDSEGGMSPATLAEHLSVTRATVTGLLDTLENDRLVERHPDPNDRRGLLIRITEAGKEKLDKVLPAHYDRIGRAMGLLSPMEQETLKVLLRKFGQGLVALEQTLNNE